MPQCADAEEWQDTEEPKGDDACSPVGIVVADVSPIGSCLLSA